MSVATSLKTSKYYDYFRDKEVIFSKANIKSLKLDPREIYLKCNGGQWPCIINSSSLQQAKIIVGTSCGIFEILRKKNDVNVSLRYGFFEQTGKIQFFVTCNVTKIEKYQDKGDLALVTLEFTQRPPDDLILKLGEFVEVNENFKIQNKQKIMINSESLRLLSIPKEETYIYIQKVPRKCIIKDISFGGVTLLLVGIPKFLEKKEVELRLLFTDNNEQISLKGIINEASFLPGRKDISIITVEYIQELVPMIYKFHINDYLTSSRKTLLQKQEKNKENPADSVIDKKVQLQQKNKQTENQSEQNQVQTQTENGESNPVESEKSESSITQEKESVETKSE